MDGMSDPNTLGNPNLPILDYSIKHAYTVYTH